MKRWKQRLQAWLSSLRTRLGELQDRLDGHTQRSTTGHMTGCTQHCNPNDSSWGVSSRIERERQLRELDVLRRRLDALQREHWLDTEGQVWSREESRGE